MDGTVFVTDIIVNLTYGLMHKVIHFPDFYPELSLQIILNKYDTILVTY